MSNVGSFLKDSLRRAVYAKALTKAINTKTAKSTVVSCFAGFGGDLFSRDFGRYNDWHNDPVFIDEYAWHDA
jgi:hypothetical protein